MLQVVWERNIFTYNRRTLTYFSGSKTACFSKSLKLFELLGFFFFFRPVFFSFLLSGKRYVVTEVKLFKMCFNFQGF